MKRGGAVYILTNAHNQVLYTGVTSDLVKRIVEYKEKKYFKSFSAYYNVDKLVYYENYLTIEEATAEEKRIKGGSRASKIKLIVSKNPSWKDLWDEISKWRTTIICNSYSISIPRTLNFKSRLLRSSQ